MGTATAPNAVRLDLEDHGQDFTHFIVKDDVIVDCGPFQGWVWIGRKLEQAKWRKGSPVRFADGKQLNYRVTKATPVHHTQAGE